MRKLQTTLLNEISFSGIGIHLGKSARIVLKPAPHDYGIHFINEKMGVDIPARWDNVCNTILSVTICDKQKGVSVSTIEHLLSALNGVGIDNVKVIVDGPEVPILDGSAKEYLKKLVGNIKYLDAPKKYVKVTKPVVVRQDTSFVYLLPSEDFGVSAKVIFPKLGEQVLHLPKIDLDTYAQNVSLAKTFGFIEDIEKLQKAGRALGASLDNAIGVSYEKGIINSDKMSYPDEFVRHKMLDIIGDMNLIGEGKSLIAYVVSYKSGHSLHVAALNELYKTQRFFEGTLDVIEASDFSVKEWTLKDILKKVFI